MESGGNSGNGEIFLAQRELLKSITPERGFKSLDEFKDRINIEISKIEDSSLSSKVDGFQRFRAEESLSRLGGLIEFSMVPDWKHLILDLPDWIIPPFQGIVEAGIREVAIITGVVGFGHKEGSLKLHKFILLLNSGFHFTISHSI